MYFCFCYKRLRLLNPNLDWKSQVFSGSACSLWNLHWRPKTYDIMHVLLPSSFSPFIISTNISFMEAYLVMNRHFYGLSHGIPLQSLERYASFEDVIKLDRCLHIRYDLKRRDYVSESILGAETRLPDENLEALPRKENAWRFLFRSTPKIIDDKLFIARFYTITGPLVHGEHLKKLIQSISIPICNHLACSAYPSCCYLMSSLPKRYLRCCPYIKSTVPYTRDDGKPFEFDAERDSCLLCSTDYDISLNERTDINETNLTVCIYHCLGSCRSPRDKLWDYLANPLPDYFPFFPHDPGSEDGSTFQELKSRVPELDCGGARRRWHETT